ncbi:MAG: AbrB/MazE/SpoVT family DNA-binding domain-containing protein [Candidatus Woesearchaeota archaeon]
MKRKIIEHGTSNALILPRKWFDKYGLKRGEELDIEESGPKLIVSAEKIKAIKDIIKIQQEPFIPYTHNIIGKIFYAGYDHIEVVVCDKTDMDVSVAKALQNIMGLELVEKGDNKIAFDVIIQESQDLFEKYEHKTFQTAIEYAKWILSCLETKNQNGLDDMTLEILNNKFSLFCERYLNKVLPKDCSFHYTILLNLEQIADEFKHIAHQIKEKKIKVSKESIVYFKKAIIYLEDLYQLFCNFDTSIHSSMYRNKIKLINYGYELCLIKPGSEAIVIGHLNDVIRHAFNCMGPIFALNLSKFKLE